MSTKSERTRRNLRSDGSEVSKEGSVASTMILTDPETEPLSEMSLLPSLSSTLTSEPSTLGLSDIPEQRPRLPEEVPIPEQVVFEASEIPVPEEKRPEDIPIPMALSEKPIAEIRDMARQLYDDVRELGRQPKYRKVDLYMDDKQELLKKIKNLRTQIRKGALRQRGRPTVQRSVSELDIPQPPPGQRRSVTELIRSQQRESGLQAALDLWQQLKGRGKSPSGKLSQRSLKKMSKGELMMAISKLRGKLNKSKK